MFTIMATVNNQMQLITDDECIWKFYQDIANSKNPEVTKIVVMGKDAFEKLPEVSHNIHHIILTSKPSQICNCDAAAVNNCEIVFDRFEKAKRSIYVIGGAFTYEEFFHHAHTLIIRQFETEMHSFDRAFPQIDENKWNKRQLTQGQIRGNRYKDLQFSRI